MLQYQYQTDWPYNNLNGDIPPNHMVLFAISKSTSQRRFEQGAPSSSMSQRTNLSRSSRYGGWCCRCHGCHVPCWCYAPDLTNTYKYPCSHILTFLTVLPCFCKTMWYHKMHSAREKHWDYTVTSGFESHVSHVDFIWGCLVQEIISASGLCSKSFTRFV